jgi:hypothetical protein
MLDRDDYRRGWEWKKDWYANNDYTQSPCDRGTNLRFN